MQFSNFEVTKKVCSKTIVENFRYEKNYLSYFSFFEIYVKNTMNLNLRGNIKNQILSTMHFMEVPLVKYVAKL